MLFTRYQDICTTLALTVFLVTAHVTVDVAALPNAKFKIDVYRK